MAIKYKRVLIKVSGEALAGDDRFGVNDAELGKVAAQIKEIRDAGVEVAVTDLAVVPREKPHTGAAAREQPRASPVIAT